MNKRSSTTWRVIADLLNLNDLQQSPKTLCVLFSHHGVVLLLMRRRIAAKRTASPTSVDRVVPLPNYC
jgi:hypothetical protein